MAEGGEEKYCMHFFTPMHFFVRTTPEDVTQKEVYVMASRSPQEANKQVYGRPMFLEEIRAYLEKEKHSFSRVMERCLGISLEGTTEKIEFEPIVIR